MSQLGEVVLDPGSKPAPGDLLLVQVFVNSRDLESGRDELRDPEAARRWLAAAGLPADGPLDEEGRLRLIEVREALRAVLMANAGDPLDPQALETLNRAASQAPLVVGFGADGRSRLEPVSAGLPAAIGRMLGIVAASMAQGTWARLKVCRKDSCRWAFYDHSKNHSGAWCSMSVCGNRVKTTAYRRRRREPEP